MDFKKIVAVAGVMVFAASVEAGGPSYEKTLKRWTRREQVFTWDNFEARLIWNATYLSEDFRAERRRKLAALYEWSDDEILRRVREDAQESRDADVFIVSIYAGSAAWPEVGKDEGQWKLVLEAEGRVVESEKFERLPVTQVERVLYPYFDKWSELYRVSFPKTLRGGPFRLRMTGVPARSELVWTP